MIASSWSKTRRVAKGEPTSVTLLTEAALTMIGADGATTDDQGCAYALASNGEKVINQPITFGGITYFSTNRPLPAGRGKLLAKPVARISAAAGVPGADLPKSCR